MPRFTLTISGQFREPISAHEFFSPLFSQLAKEPTINPDLLKGTLQKADGLVVGLLGNRSSPKPSCAHLTVEVLDDRRSPFILDEFADIIDNYIREHFRKSLADSQLRCFITCDIRYIPARWHRSIARGHLATGHSTGPITAGTLSGNPVRNNICAKPRKDRPSPSMSLRAAHLNYPLEPTRRPISSALRPLRPLYPFTPSLRLPI